MAEDPLRILQAFLFTVFPLFKHLQGFQSVEAYRSKAPSYTHADFLLHGRGFFLSKLHI